MPRPGDGTALNQGLAYGTVKKATEFWLLCQNLSELGMRTFRFQCSLIRRAEGNTEICEYFATSRNND